MGIPDGRSSLAKWPTKTWRRGRAQRRPGHLAQGCGRACPVVAVSKKGGGRESARLVLAMRPAVMTDETQRSEREMRIRAINQSEDGEDEDEQH